MYVPGTVLGTECPVKNKTGLVPVLVRVSLERKDRQENK